MARILVEGDLRTVLDSKAVVNALAEAHVAFSTGKAVQPVRLQLQISEHDGRFLVMPGYLPALRVAATKIISGFEGNAALGLPTALGVVVLHDARTGQTLSIMDAAYLTGVRTAAASALATHHLARADAKVLGIIGAGYIGRMHCQVFARLIKLDRIIVTSRTMKSALALQAAVERDTGLNVEVYPTPREVCGEADILVTATSARTPLIRYDWLKEGMHINAVGASTPDAREIDTETVERARVVVDSREAVANEGGDILIPLEAGDISSDHADTELGEVIAGTKDGRSDASQLTLFKSLGLAIQDVAVAQLAYEKAMESGVGVDVGLR